MAQEPFSEGSPQTAPAGWYVDPHGGGQRYWDGVRWADHYAPSAAPAHAATARTDGDDKELVILGFALAVLMPIFGAIAGIVLLAKNRIGPGIGVLVCSVLAFIIWASVFYGS